jgi:hypothetical protein
MDVDQIRALRERVDVQLSGSLPDTLSDLAGLTTLRLSENAFTTMDPEMLQVRTRRLSAFHSVSA